MLNVLLLIKRFLVRSEWLAQKLTAQFQKLAEASIIEKIDF